jgi:hypothetical protein
MKMVVTDSPTATETPLAVAGWALNQIFVMYPFLAVYHGVAFSGGENTTITASWPIRAGF